MKNVFKLTTLALTMMLVACGGGGGSTPSAPVSSTCTNGASDYPSCSVLPANLQTNPPTPTYTADSAQLQAYNEIANIRKALGLGALYQNAKLDAAAANHVNYINVNVDADLSAFGHSENAVLSGFTGAMPPDRGAFTGYGRGVAEDIASNNYSGVIQSPVQALIGSVYHRASILNQCVKDIGIGYGKHTTPIGLIINPLVIDLGNQNGCQTNASDFVYTYPIANQSNVPLSMVPESPVAFSDLPKDQNGKLDWKNGTSYPITIAVAAGNALVMSSYTVLEQGSSTPLDMRVLNNANDPNKFLAPNEITLVGKAPFKASTTYNIVFNYTVNGKASTKSFSITTAATNN